MRACFLGQNVCALGYGVATLQMPPLPESAPGETGKPGDLPAYPVVMPADGHEYGRSAFYRLLHPLPARL